MKACVVRATFVIKTRSAPKCDRGKLVGRVRCVYGTGSILVHSTEGIARAYELEIGAPVYDWEEAMLQRPPQLEDYVAT